MRLEEEKEEKKWKAYGLESQTRAPHARLPPSSWLTQGHSTATPCSPGSGNSSRKEAALSFQTGEVDGKAGRQALACQEGPGPTPTKTGTDQTTGMSVKPVL